MLDAGGGHGGPRPSQQAAPPSAPGRQVALDAIIDMVLCPITQVGLLCCGHIHVQHLAMRHPRVGQVKQECRASRR